MKDIFPLNYEDVRSGVFPTTKVFKNLKLLRDVPKEREVLYFYMSKKAIKRYWEKINQTFKQMKINRTKYPYRIYTNPVYNRLYLCYGVKKIMKDEMEENDLDFLIMRSVELY